MASYATPTCTISVFFFFGVGKTIIVDIVDIVQILTRIYRLHSIVLKLHFLAFG